MKKSFSWENETDRCQIGATHIMRIVDLDRQAFEPKIIFPAATGEVMQKKTANLNDHNFDQNTLALFLSFHAYLVRIKNKTILVDMCLGNDKTRIERPIWHQRNGPFIENLKNAGVEPTDVDYVMCTHLHADHVGWNTKLLNGEWVPTFPNAEYIFSEKEYNHWRREDGRYSSEEQILHGSFHDSVMPIISSGQARLVPSNFNLGNGVHLEPAYGHTPGNIMIHIEDCQEHAVLCGDILHHPIQLGHPEWKTNFCSDPEQATLTRLNLLREYAGTKTAILPAHFHSADLGLISKDNGSYILNKKLNNK